MLFALVLSVVDELLVTLIILCTRLSSPLLMDIKFFSFLKIYLLIFREGEGREDKRERDISWLRGREMLM